MRKTARVIAALAMLGMPAAYAQDFKTVSLPRNPDEAFAHENGRALPPAGWAGFCKTYPADCDVPELERADIDLSPLVWRTLVSVNTRVNKAITPITDEEHWGVVERWSYPDDGKGDCEDYALLKRKLLIDAGLPRQALLMTVVRDQQGEGHAVLTVVTNRGDFILDNKRTRILRWDDTGFSFVKRQSREDPNRWVAIGDPYGASATAAR